MWEGLGNVGLLPPTAVGREPAFGSGALAKGNC